MGTTTTTTTTTTAPPPHLRSTNTSRPAKNSKIPTFNDTCQNTTPGSSGHSIGISPTGHAYTWTTRRNDFGQLGRPTSKKNTNTPTPIDMTNLPPDITFHRGDVGGSIESGHTSLLDTNGRLWMCGCDRWQQLGLGSINAGAAGYTWENGAIWQERFRECTSLRDIMRVTEGGTDDEPNKIRDVALGADHSVVLSSNRRHVYTWGRGEYGQLGFVGKPFVSPPQVSTKLSLRKTTTTTTEGGGGGSGIAAVCAPINCTVTLNDEGVVMAHVGKCRNVSEALEVCRRRAEQRGLINRSGGRRGSGDGDNGEDE